MQFMKLSIPLILAELEPTVAFPHLPENTKTIDEITEPVVIDQVCDRFLYKRPYR